MLHALITFAAEEAARGDLEDAVLRLRRLARRVGVVVSAIGIRAHETFPPTKSAARGVMTISLVLVVLAMASAVITG